MQSSGEEVGGWGGRGDSGVKGERRKLPEYVS